jgi:hypothetical protein
MLASMLALQHQCWYQRVAMGHAQPSTNAMPPQGALRNISISNFITTLAIPCISTMPLSCMRQ